MNRGSVFVLVLAACGANKQAAQPPAAPPIAEAAPMSRPDPFASVAAFAEAVANRGALPPQDDPWGDNATQVRLLSQNWGPIDGLWFWYADQGSRLIRREVLLNLETVDGSGPLASNETWLQYRLLIQDKTPNNPDGLPVGLTRNGDYVGFTCAACHTGQIVVGDTALRIDGAPSQMDMNGLLGAFGASIDATIADEARLRRFFAAAGVMGDEEKEAELRVYLEQAGQFFTSYNRNYAANLGGYGRVDAIGGIVNQVIRVTSGTTNSIVADAPTSFPLLWDAPRHDWLQWTAFSSNSAIGSLGRNAGEVVGVFGELHVTGIHDQEENKRGFSTSIQAHNLVDIEETLWKLQSPVWPEDLLPPIDRALAEKGQAVYQQQCIRCHALLDRDDPNRRVTAMVFGVDQVGTDPKTADNLVDAVVPTGILEGSLNVDGSGVLGPTASALDLLVVVGANAIKEQKGAALRTLGNAKRWGLDESAKQGDYPANTEEQPLASLRAYKARPLNGIWASSPYLHNGSVPTLYDLLLPESQRPKQFTVGRWAYDAKRVGYVSTGDGPGVLDTSVPGNHNSGHTYGTSLNEADRVALVEYLKTL